ncbi:hypothetical protein SPI_06727 [Niveomyces insectorum RCEF 264]|uniref:Uncharacterized protein n=1 Tax=Niveomyces insectorum RCEF 264 TaxID=1081102 RepID=A0A167QQ05_9HYPO|nr:hypothetical protein SPI_06727 [Niveomyces insectorum RCEF 264]
MGGGWMMGDGGWHGDGVVPTEDELWDTHCGRQRQWASLLRRARETTHLQPRSIRPEQLLHLVPDLPRDLQNVHAIAGRASWQRQRCASDGDDGLPTTTTTRMEAERHWRRSLPSGRPTLCSLSRETLLERQGIAVQYTATASHPTDRANRVDVDIGIASAAERKWWRALVAPGNGWLPAGKERPPWTEVHRGDVCLRIKADGPDTACFTSALDASDTPPSSEQAVRYLTRFAALHGLDDQAMLALAMALVLPLLNETRSAVALPRPCELSRQPWQPRREAAPTPAWLRPVHNLVLPLVQAGHVENLAQLLARRCPAVAPLCYGTPACGPPTTTVRGPPRLLATTQTPSMSRPLPEVAVWTRSPLSFMDLRGSGPYLLELPTSSTEPCRVQRQDVWRLRHELYDATEPCSRPFRSPPLCPWLPFGTMGEDEVEPSGPMVCKAAHDGQERTQAPPQSLHSRWNSTRPPADRLLATYFAGRRRRWNCLGKTVTSTRGYRPRLI